MHAPELRDWLQRRPFRPFRIWLTNGVAFEIRHPDQAAVVGAHTLHVGFPPPSPDDITPTRDVAVALVHITHLEPLLPRNPPPAG